MPPRNKKRRRTSKRHHKQVANMIPPSEASDTEIHFLMRHFEDSLVMQTDLDTLMVDQNSVNDEFFILGEGSFGLVTLGTLRKPDGKVRRVALKGAIKFIYLNMMKIEAEVMAKFDHVNVVKLLGVQKAPFKIIMEYMQHGDLLDALQKNVFPNRRDLLEVLIQVASGMEYISEMNYVHRDLACRNVFVNVKKQCKIGDFGLCTYVGNTGGVYKMKEKHYFNEFCAPEVMDTDKFTTKCDVWSMGLLIWELYFSASKNFPAFYKRVFLDLFIVTGTLTKPELCPLDLFLYTKSVLLNDDPTKRPFFSEVKKYLCDFNNKYGSQLCILK